MHTIWTRANALFTLAMTVMSVMCALTTLTTYLHEPAPVVRTLSLNAVHSLKRYRDRTDKAVLSFDLDADLSSVFNWNTKQLFVYIVAEYASKTNEKNEVVIWDAIVPSKDDAILQRKDEGVKYFLADQFDQLRNAQVTMKLKWDIMPVCGRLFQYTEGSTEFTMPAQYIGKQTKL
ncbi:signal peptidase complex subunit 3 [Thraustotheca clavata]|uniref:Signal peptidase complex subunit 3 n=1 Tax=Thraustotheca clavata TaxID=74557 RepID=A0A1W0A6I6_9STRA|nr:signal peptidase complex subunit 3 [Thraustotheca clavata]